MNDMNHDRAIIEGLLNGHLVNRKELNNKILDSMKFTITANAFLGLLLVLVFCVTCLNFLYDRARIAQLEQEVAKLNVH